MFCCYQLLSCVEEKQSWICVGAQQSFLLGSCCSCERNRLQLCVLQGLLVMTGGCVEIIDAGQKGMMVVVDVEGSLRFIFCLFGPET